MNIRRRRNFSDISEHGLIIIDMQPCFSSARNCILQNNIIALIRRVKTWIRPIILVEFQWCDKTVESITKELDSYGSVQCISKWSDDGSVEIKAAMRRFSVVNAKKWFICGVNLSCCVYSTVEGLSVLLPDHQFHVLRNLCNDSIHYPHKVVYEDFKKMPNVSVM